ncbi:MAG: prepilin-type N-terminal cleavage/methylation domain-containing protein [Nitrospirae bacterium]|nr:prepilin-type N-terminal cleavage/methylation domain-containing protein [Nitrospirota bacterium]
MLTAVRGYRRTITGSRGVTLIELIVAVAIIAIIALFTAPQIGRFKSNYNLRSCATELFQNMRLARAMAINENRAYLIVFDTLNGRYLIGFDADGDDALTTANNDTFGFCKDADGDRLPEGDTDADGDGVPDCVRVVNLNNCGDNIVFGYGSGTTPPNRPDGAAISTSGIGLDSGASFISFTANGAAETTGLIYMQQTSRGYSYSVQISNTSGSMNMWKWNGDKDNSTVTTWTEIR